MDFSKTLGRLVGTAHDAFLRNLDDAFARAGVDLTAEQFKMMSRLWQDDGVSQQELADGIGRNRAATGKMIDTMEKKGLLKRFDHPTDRRQNLVFVTRTGRQMQGKAEMCAQEVLDKATRSFSRGDEQQLKDWLGKIIRNLS